MRQAGLFDEQLARTEPGLARTEDPLSSHEAADRVLRSGVRRGNALTVLAALQRQGRCTARELAAWMWRRHIRLNKPTLGDLYHEVVRRLHDLAERGLAQAELRDTRRCQVSGRPVQIWQATGSVKPERCG